MPHGGAVLPRIARVAASRHIPSQIEGRLTFRWDGSRGESEGVYLDDYSY